MRFNCAERCGTNRAVDRESREQDKYVAVTGMHGMAESRQDARFREILNQAALVVPDGMPLLWLGDGTGIRFAGA